MFERLLGAKEAATKTDTANGFDEKYAENVLQEIQTAVEKASKKGRYYTYVTISGGFCRSQLYVPMLTALKEKGYGVSTETTLLGAVEVRLAW